MGHNGLIGDLIHAVGAVLRRAVQLVILPYQTMREISREKDDLQIAVVFGFVCAYYLLAPSIRPEIVSPVVQFSLVLFHFVMTVGFIGLFARILTGEVHLRRIAMLCAYTLIPTIIWFFLTSALFYFLPPPRTTSILGQIFTVVYLTISISLLVWKVMLWYLAVRFGTRLRFFTIIFLGILYLVVVVPYSFYLYYFGLFRIPFL